MRGIAERVTFWEWQMKVIAERVTFSLMSDERCYRKGKILGMAELGVLLKGWNHNLCTLRLLQVRN